MAHFSVTSHQPADMGCFSWYAGEIICAGATPEMGGKEDRRNTQGDNSGLGTRSEPIDRPTHSRAPKTRSTASGRQHFSRNFAIFHLSASHVSVNFNPGGGVATAARTKGCQ